MTTRERWMVGGAAAMAVVVIVLLVLLLAGGDDDKDETAPTTTTSTTLAVTTTIAPVTTTTAPTSVTVGIICSTPEDAAHSLIDAQIANDETAAHRCASSAAVDALFPTSDADATYTFQGCLTSETPVTCSFTYEGGAVTFVMSGSAAAGWKVDSAGFVAD